MYGRDEVPCARCGDMIERLAFKNRSFQPLPGLPAGAERTRVTPSERYRRSLWQFVKFGFVGGSGVLVNMAVAIVMNKLNGGSQNAQDVIWAIPGTDFNVRFTAIVWIVAFLIANLWNFQLNRSWTFKTGKHAGWFQEFWPFLAVGSVAAVVGLVLKLLMTNPTSPLYLPEPYFHEERGLQSREYWSQLIAIIITMPINFLVNKFWTFRAIRGKSDEVVEVAE